MAAPTEKQIRDLEKAHKQQLVNLLQAIRFRKMLYSKTFDGKTGSQSEPWKHYAKLVWDLWSSWYARQMKMEKNPGVQKEGIKADDWNTPDGQKKLEALAKKWDQTGQGVIGFIPLIIWGIIAIAGMFTAVEITDELNTTEEEQADLIKTSNDYCTKYNLTKEECQKFMTQQTTTLQTNTEGSGMGTMIKWGLIAFVGLKAFESFSKNRQQKTA